jgi:hypothetical protein
LKFLSDILKTLIAFIILLGLLIGSLYFYFRPKGEPYWEKIKTTYVPKKMEGIVKEIDKEITLVHPEHKVKREKIQEKEVKLEEIGKKNKRKEASLSFKPKSLSKDNDSLTLEDIKLILRNLSGGESLREEKKDKKTTQESYNKELIKDKIVEYSILTGLNPRLALAVAQVESGLNPTARSPRGAIGVFQIMPSLAREYGYSADELFDPDVSICLGIRILKEYMDYFNNDIKLALSAYHAGFERVKDSWQVPDIEATRQYIRRVKRVMEDISV